MVEGSSPSPVTEQRTHRKAREHVKKPGNPGVFGMAEPELSRPSSRTQANENELERPPVTTQITTHPLPGDEIVIPADPAEFVYPWKELPEAIRAGILAMVRSCKT